MSDVNFTLKLDKTQFSQALSSAGIAVNQFSDQTNTSLNQTENSLNKVSEAGATSSLSLGSFSVAMFAANLATQVFNTVYSALQNTLTGSISAFLESQDAVNKLNQSFSGSGQTKESVEKTTQAIKDFADELQANSTIDDDAVIRQVAYARSLGLSSEASANMVKAAANMSAAIGGGLEENMQKLSLTLDGTPGRLKKLIPELKSLTEEQLKAGAASDIINKKFGGAARNEMNSYAGQMKVLSNQFGDLQKELGKAIFDTGAFKYGMELIKKVFTEFIPYLKENTDLFKKWALGIALVVGPVLTAVSVVYTITKAIALFETGMAVFAAAAAAAVVPVTAFAAAFAVISIGIIASVAFLVNNLDKVRIKIHEMNISFNTTLLSMTQSINRFFGTKISTNAFDEDISKSTNRIKELKLAIDIANIAKDEARKPIGPLPPPPKLSSKDKAGETDNEALILYNKQRNKIVADSIVQINNLEAEGRQTQLEALHTFEADKRAADVANSTLEYDEKQAAQQTILTDRIAQEGQDLLARQAIQQAQLDELFAFEQAKASIIKESLDRRKAYEDAETKNNIAQKTLSNKKELESEALSLKSKKSMYEKDAADKKTTTDFKNKMEESYLTSTQGYLQAAVVLLKLHGREAKAIAITDAIIATYLGATKAFASVPYPANFFAAGSIIAGGLANVAKITSSGNYAEGGFIPGQSFQGDRLIANVNSGEAILNTSQQKQFMTIANGGGDNNNSMLDSINRLGDRIANLTITMVANDTEIARSASRGVMQGISIGVSR